MKSRFSGFDEGPVSDPTPVPSQWRGSTVPSKRARAPPRQASCQEDGPRQCAHAERRSEREWVEDEKYYTVEEVADILNVSPRTVRRWVRSKVVKSYKFGAARRIASSGLQALIARSCDI